MENQSIKYKFILPHTIHNTCMINNNLLCLDEYLHLLGSSTWISRCCRDDNEETLFGCFSSGIEDYIVVLIYDIVHAFRSFKMGHHKNHICKYQSTYLQQYYHYNTHHSSCNNRRNH